MFLMICSSIVSTWGKGILINFDHLFQEVFFHVCQPVIMYSAHVALISIFLIHTLRFEKSNVLTYPRYLGTR